MRAYMLQAGELTVSASTMMSLLAKTQGMACICTAVGNYVHVYETEYWMVM